MVTPRIKRICVFCFFSCLIVTKQMLYHVFLNFPLESFFAVLAFNDMKNSNCKFNNETLFYPFLFASSCQGNEDGRAACVMLFLLLNPTGAKILF